MGTQLEELGAVSPGRGQTKTDGPGGSEAACPGHFSAPEAGVGEPGLGRDLVGKSRGAGLGGLAPSVASRAQLPALRVVSSPAMCLSSIASFPWRTCVAGSRSSCQSWPVIRLEWAGARCGSDPSSKDWLRPRGGFLEPLPQDFCSQDFCSQGGPRPCLPWDRGLSLARASSVKWGPQLLPLGVPPTPGPRVSTRA